MLAVNRYNKCLRPSTLKEGSFGLSVLYHIGAITFVGVGIAWRGCSQIKTVQLRAGKKSEKLES